MSWWGVTFNNFSTLNFDEKTSVTTSKFALRLFRGPLNKILLSVISIFLNDFQHNKKVTYGNFYAMMNLIFTVYCFEHYLNQRKIFSFIFVICHKLISFCVLQRKKKNRGKTDTESETFNVSAMFTKGKYYLNKGHGFDPWVLVEFHAVQMKRLKDAPNRKRKILGKWNHLWK